MRSNTSFISASPSYSSLPAPPSCPLRIGPCIGSSRSNRPLYPHPFEMTSLTGDHR